MNFEIVLNSQMKVLIWREIEQEMKKKKICLISSSGGHFEQLLMLKKLSKNNDIFIVTEKTKYNKNDKKINYYVNQVNRKEMLFIIKMAFIFIKSLYIFIKE